MKSRNLVILLVIVSFFQLHSLKTRSAMGVYNKKSIIRLHSDSNKAAIALMKKGKMKQLGELFTEIETEGDSHFIKKFLNKKEWPFGIDKPVNFLDAVRLNRGSISIVAEYNKKAKTGFIIGLPPPEILSGVLRDAGAKSVVISVDPRSGGATFEEFKRFAVEQTKSKLLLPGPLALVYNDLVVDKVQVECAAALGASAIVLTPNIVDDLSYYVTYSKELGMDPIVFVKNQDEAKLALDAGANILCICNLQETEIVNLRKQLPSFEERPDLIIMAKLSADVDFSTYQEIDTAWLLRDSEITAIWPSAEAIYSTGMSDVYANISAMRSKASRIFISPRQYLMDRKKEGATEFLGDILY